MSTTANNLPVNVNLVMAMRREFPDWVNASPEGFLCMGGDLKPERLLAAYSLGNFPWFSEGDPILWWNLTPRAILPLENFHLPKRSIRTLKKSGYVLTFDQAFEEVIRSCSKPRKDDGGTWIVPKMIQAYLRLHKLGYAHSVETWLDGTLVGGLYGLGIARAFFGESMFHVLPEASRLALFGLIQILTERKIVLLDCQQETPHMVKMGCITVPGEIFQRLLIAAGLGFAPNHPECWQPWQGHYEFSDCSSSWRLKSK